MFLYFIFCMTPSCSVSLDLQKNKIKKNLQFSKVTGTLSVSDGQLYQMPDLIV